MRRKINRYLTFPFFSLISANINFQHRFLILQIVSVLEIRIIFLRSTLVTFGTASSLPLLHVIGNVDGSSMLHLDIEKYSFFLFQNNNHTFKLSITVSSMELSIECGPTLTSKRDVISYLLERSIKSIMDMLSYYQTSLRTFVFDAPSSSVSIQVEFKIISSVLQTEISIKLLRRTKGDDQCVLPLENYYINSLLHSQ